MKKKSITIIAILGAIISLLAIILFSTNEFNTSNCLSLAVLKSTIGE